MVRYILFIWKISHQTPKIINKVHSIDFLDHDYKSIYILITRFTIFGHRAKIIKVWNTDSFYYSVYFIEL